MTISKNSVSAAEKLQQGDNAAQPVDSSLDGRLAFYLNGKVTQNWHLTASADTREGPVKDLFSNFLDKQPIRYSGASIPTIITRRSATTVCGRNCADSGQVLRQSEPRPGLWNVGQLQGCLRGNDLAHVDRGLYGADAHFGSGLTSFGERRITADGFAAQPGTLASYEQFLGTGGSIYFLHTRTS